MKKISRRDRLKIYGDLLSALRKSETNGQKVVLTHVQVQINVPFDRLKSYIRELRELGFIVDETSFKLTEKGRKYLREYEKIIDFMKQMGLTY
jgi:predicted transcriptional regulator